MKVNARSNNIIIRIIIIVVVISTEYINVRDADAAFYTRR